VGGEKSEGQKASSGEMRNKPTKEKKRPKVLLKKWRPSVEDQAGGKPSGKRKREGKIQISGTQEIRRGERE